MPEKISIVKDSGETISSNIVSVFMIPDTEKKYIITTENAVDPHGLTVLHVSEIVDGTLQKIATDDEWSTIKTIMRAIISGNVVSYKYLPPIESINAASQYSRDISVSASASKQMVDNYNIADKSGVDETPAVTETDSASTDSNQDSGFTPPVADTAEVAVSQEAIPSLPQPNSIFPTNIQGGNGDELIPGISEVSEEAVAAPSIDPMSVQSNPNAGLVVNMDQGQVQQPLNLTQEFSIDPVTGMPVAQQGALNQFVDNQQGMMPNGMIPTNDMQMMNGMVQNEVQVVDPSQIVPNGQIVQDAMMNNMNMGINPNVVPSFNANATLDEVVLASQEMFMEGVKNLIQSIQEKVYRDLYAKEAALKAREDALIQREQMLVANQQMMSFNPMMQTQISNTLPQNNIGLTNSNMMMNPQMNSMIQQQVFPNQQGMMQNPAMNTMQVMPNGPVSMPPVGVNQNNGMM